MSGWVYLAIITKPPPLNYVLESPTIRTPHRIVICPSENLVHDRFISLPWKEISNLLRGCDHLFLVEVLCGANVSSDAATQFFTDLTDYMDGLPAQFQHVTQFKNPSDIYPQLFELKDPQNEIIRQLIDTNEPVVRISTNSPPDF